MLKVLGKKLRFVTELTEGNIFQAKEATITGEVRHLEWVKENSNDLVPSRPSENHSVVSYGPKKI